MRQTVRPAGRLSGVVILPGDKSISHRYAMIASLAEGASKIANYSTGADCHSTLGCVRALGIEVEEAGHNGHDPRPRTQRMEAAAAAISTPAIPARPFA